MIGAVAVWLPMEGTMRGAARRRGRRLATFIRRGQKPKRNQKEIKKKSRTFGSSAGMVVQRRKLEARRCETVHTQAAVRYISHLIITAAYGAMTAGDEF